MTSEKQARFWRLLAGLSLALAILALLMLILPGPGFRIGLWEFGTAIAVFRWAFYLAVAVGAVSFLAFLVAVAGAYKPSALRLVVAVFLCAIVAGTLYFLRSDAVTYVPIHDVTTDLDDPPEFVAISPRVEDPLIVPDRGRSDLAQVDPKTRWRIYHEEAYGDIEPLSLDASPRAAIELIRAVASDMGWDIAAVDVDAGRLEATDTTAWFGFKDDVVVRVRPEGAAGSRIDVRSVSRIGVSDIGKNAERVRAFLGAVAERAAGGA